MFAHIVLLALIVAPIGFLQPMFASAAVSGDLIKCPDFSAVYYVADDGSRWVFPNDKIYFSWFSDFDDVITVSCDELASFPIGRNVPYQSGTRLVKLQSTPTVYAVAPGGVLHPIDSEADAISLYGANWAKRVDDLSDAFFPRYDVRVAVSSSQYPDGTIIKNSETGSYYFVENDVRRLIPERDLSSTLAAFALIRTAPFDGTTFGTAFTLSEWDSYKKADRAAVNVPVVVTQPGELPAPTLSVSSDLILNGEPYVLSWNEVDAQDETLYYQLQEDTTHTFVSPLLLLNQDLTSYKTEKESQVNPNYHYRVRVTDGEVISPWSNAIEVDILNAYYIPGVQDVSMPVSNNIGLVDATSSSVPIAAANVLHYLDQRKKDVNALGVSAAKMVKDLGDYLAWFMNLNDRGSQDRLNDGDAGVYHADIQPALEEFLQWDGNEDPWQGFEAPEELLHKTAYNNWTVKEIRAGSVNDSSALSQIANAVKEGYPVIGVYYYWNPEATGQRLGAIRFYDIGSEVVSSVDSTLGNTIGVPHETWKPTVSNVGVGHGVTVLGYIPDYDTLPDDDVEDKKDYLIVYDGWSATFSLMAVPVDEWARFYVLTPAASGPPTSAPSVSMVSSVGSGDLVTIAWSALDKATYYELQWSVDDAFINPEGFVTTAFDSVTEYLNTHVVSESTTFYYRLRGHNEHGFSDWSKTKTLLVTP